MIFSRFTSLLKKDTAKITLAHFSGIAHSRAIEAKRCMYITRRPDDPQTPHPGSSHAAHLHPGRGADTTTTGPTGPDVPSTCLRAFVLANLLTSLTTGGRLYLLTCLLSFPVVPAPALARRERPCEHTRGALTHSLTYFVLGTVPQTWQTFLTPQLIGTSLIRTRAVIPGGKLRRTGELERLHFNLWRRMTLTKHGAVSPGTENHRRGQNQERSGGARRQNVQ